MVKKLLRSQSGDTLVEVIIALTILSAVLTGATKLAISAFQTAQTARERTAAAYAAQQQAELLRGFRDNRTWDDFSDGGGAGPYAYDGVLTVPNSGTCRTVVGHCFHFEPRNVSATQTDFVPVPGGTTAPNVPNSYVEITIANSTADTATFVVSYGFPNISGGPDQTGHIRTFLVKLSR